MKQGGVTGIVGPLVHVFMPFFFFPIMTLLSTLVNLYKRLMTFPVRELYVQLPGFVMRPLCRLFLTLLPAKYEGANTKEKKKVLFVVNHGLLSWDVAHLWASIYLQTGVFPRGLADRFFFSVPGLAHLFHFMGAIKGDRDLCQQAMAQGFPLLVFPGGSKEVCRKKGFKRYSLEWGTRSGFARLALKHGYTIVPVASVGMDDIVEIVVDAPVGFILKHVFGDPRSDLTWPIVRPASFQTQYFYFCEEIHTKDLQFNETNVQVIRETAYNSLTTGINKMLQKRETDPDRYPISFTRLLSKLKGN